MRPVDRLHLPVALAEVLDTIASTRPLLVFTSAVPGPLYTLSLPPRLVPLPATTRPFRGGRRGARLEKSAGPVSIATDDGCLALACRLSLRGPVGEWDFVSLTGAPSPAAGMVGFEYGGVRHDDGGSPVRCERPPVTLLGQSLSLRRGGRTDRSCVCTGRPRSLPAGAWFHQSRRPPALGRKPRNICSRDPGLSIRLRRRVPTVPAHEGYWGIVAQALIPAASAPRSITTSSSEPHVVTSSPSCVIGTARHVSKRRRGADRRAVRRLAEEHAQSRKRHLDVTRRRRHLGAPPNLCDASRHTPAHARRFKRNDPTNELAPRAPHLAADDAAESCAEDRSRTLPRAMVDRSANRRSLESPLGSLQYQARALPSRRIPVSDGRARVSPEEARAAASSLGGPCLQGASAHRRPRQEPRGVKLRQTPPTRAKHGTSRARPPGHVRPQALIEKARAVGMDTTPLYHVRPRRESRSSCSRRHGGRRDRAGSPRRTPDGLIRLAGRSLSGLSALGRTPLI